MDELIKIIIGISGTVLGGFFGYFSRLFIEHRLAIDRIKENIKLSEIQKASSKFKSFVIYELSGFYPINQHWEKNEFHRLYDSIPRINSAAAEFRYFVGSKTNFDKAIDEYNKYCRETTSKHVSADIMYPDMRKEGEISKREQFKNIVENILSFAN